MRPLVRLVIAATFIPFVANAQAPTRPSIDTLPRPMAKPSDVSSVDAIIAALYDVISGPAGQARDWNRFRSLFVPNARLIPSRPRPDGGADAGVWSVDDYAAAAGPRLEKTGFFEREISRREESFGNIAHLFSTYESRRTSADPTPFARGLNSIQVMKDGGRYWIVTVFWDAERSDNPIPSKYLKQSP